MSQEEMIACLREKFAVLDAVLDERGRRLWAVTEAKALGRGGQTLVAKATGLSRRTIYQGLRELEYLSRCHPTAPQRIRTPGGGRKPLTAHDPTLLADLEALVEPTSRGDPESPLRWTCKSVRQLAAELQRQGHKVGRQKVAELLADLAYSLQGNRKTKEGREHPDRNAQFEHINAQVAAFQKRGQPVVSVDTKKKELVGDFKNGGREWRPQGDPELVRTYDFADKTLGKINPYGVYDQTAHVGWVSVGVDHDTAEFAVESIQGWWTKMGACRYKDATDLLITADGGGSNGSRNRLWKVALQRLADATGLRIAVCHFPPGTSKWNKIEHRMFSHISMNWRGQPLTSHEVIVNLIANTTTEKGLTIQAELDTRCYPTGIKVTEQELQAVALEPAAFHGEWNYTIAPRVMHI
ncbi:MAG: ISAzo13 family transposase [Candidatus Tectomicrobia bacterium]|uniref:ISAzo13 family transposase n=1 Tax=Tectimicrobiota bacterium TaxID=2528274 RepID=A0A937W7F5_UNCTE|nr:ISAzo13 family transposase [Candidatus Tectomicrobia bacterium]